MKKGKTKLSFVHAVFLIAKNVYKIAKFKFYGLGSLSGSALFHFFGSLVPDAHSKCGFGYGSGSMAYDLASNSKFKYKIVLLLLLWKKRTLTFELQKLEKAVLWIRTDFVRIRIRILILMSIRIRIWLRIRTGFE